MKIAGQAVSLPVGGAAPRGPILHKVEEFRQKKAIGELTIQKFQIFNP